jgi:hypothetical protein
MTERWYYRIFGQEFGPVLFEELREITEQGILAAEDEVRNVTEAQWTKVKTLAARAVTDPRTQAPDPDHFPSEAISEAVSKSIGSDSWYCLFHGQESGPFGFQKLIKFAEKGHLLTNDKVKLGTDGKWRQAGSIGRIMAVMPYPSGRINETNSMFSPGPTKRQTVHADANSADCQEPEDARHTPLQERKERLRGLKETAQLPAGTEIDIDRAKLNHRDAFQSGHQTIAPSGQRLTIASEDLTRITTSGVLASSSRTREPRSLAVGGRWESKPRAMKNQTSRLFLKSSRECTHDHLSLAVIGIVCLTLLCGSWNYLPGRNSANVKRYTELKRVLDQIRLSRRIQTTDYSAIILESEDTGKRIARSLEKTVGNRAEKELLWATRDELPLMIRALKNNPSIPSKAEDFFSAHLKEAAQKLGIK